MAILALGTDASPAQEQSARRPNILLIAADDLGFSDLGCYGSEIATPNLDSLAAGGLRFTQGYNTARCWPSRAALLTGYYAQQVRRDAVPGIRSGGQGVRPAWARLLPEKLRGLGYRSYHSGKWHIDGSPLKNGFDRSYSLDDHDRHFAPRSHRESGEPLPAVDPASGYYSSTAIADYTIRYLNEHQKDHAGQPFFAFVAFTAPHFPVQAPRADIARYLELYQKGWDELRDNRWQRLQTLNIGGPSLAPIERDVGPPYQFPEALRKLGPGELDLPLPWSELSEEQRKFQAGKMAVHAAMVDRMDREIGRLIEQLRSMGEFENTLVVFLSDNGASAEIMVRGDGHDQNAEIGTGATFLCIGPGWSSLANTPFRRHKTWVHEGGISTPLVVHWPNGIAAQGELRHTPCHVIDMVPTLLAVAGVPDPRSLRDPEGPEYPGKSWLPVLDRDGPLARESLWWQHEGNRALRIDDWKIVAAGADANWELYDLSTDRAETNNLAAARPERVRVMSELWDKQFRQFVADASRGAPAQTPLPGDRK
jgi:arylsulfatase A-like enzyme